MVHKLIALFLMLSMVFISLESSALCQESPCSNFDAVNGLYVVSIIVAGDIARGDMSERDSRFAYDLAMAIGNMFLSYSDLYYFKKFVDDLRLISNEKNQDMMACMNQLVLGFGRDDALVRILKRNIHIENDHIRQVVLELKENEKCFVVISSALKRLSNKSETVGSCRSYGQDVLKCSGELHALMDELGFMVGSSNGGKQLGCAALVSLGLKKTIRGQRVLNAMSQAIKLMLRGGVVDREKSNVLVADFERALNEFMAFGGAPLSGAAGQYACDGIGKIATEGLRVHAEIWSYFQRDLESFKAETAMSPKSQ